MRSVKVAIRAVAILGVTWLAVSAAPAVAELECSQCRTCPGCVVMAAQPPLAHAAAVYVARVQERRVLKIVDDCESCALVVRELVDIRGSDGDLAWIERLMDLAVDAHGRYWFAFGRAAPLVNVVAADGRFLGTVGRRGQGPGEFESADAVVPVGDSMWIFDSALQRATVAGPDLSPRRSFRFPGQVYGGVSAGWPRMILNADVPTPGGVGRAYHILNVATGAIEVSFGGVESYSRRDQRLLIGHLALDAASSELWTISRARFEIQRWSLRGELIESFVAPADWFSTDGVGSLGSPTRPPDPVTVALRVVGPGLLVLFETPIPDWRSAWPRRTATRGGHPLPSEMPSVPLRRPKAALVDPRFGTVVRVWEHTLRIGGLGNASDVLVQAAQESDGLYPRVRLLDVSVRR